MATPAPTREASSLRRVFNELAITHRQFRLRSGQHASPALRDAARAFKEAPSFPQLVLVAAFLEEDGLLQQALAGGFAEVLPERVTILADISERSEAIDRDRAERARDRALKRLRDREPGTDFDRAQIALMKSLIRLQISRGIGSNETS